VFLTFLVIGSSSFLGGGFYGPEGKPYSGNICTILVPDITAHLKSIEENGGKITAGKVLIGENIGWSAYFTDTEGNHVGLYEAWKKT